MGKQQQTRIQTKQALLMKANKASKPISKPEKKDVKPLHNWNRSKLTMGDYFSCHQYMQVT